jgi:hypothetical protein
VIWQEPVPTCPLILHPPKLDEVQMVPDGLLKHVWPCAAATSTPSSTAILYWLFIFCFTPGTVF